MQLPIYTFFNATSKCSFFIISDIEFPVFATSSSNIFIYGNPFFPYNLNLYDKYSINVSLDENDSIQKKLIAKND